MQSHFPKLALTRRYVIHSATALLLILQTVTNTHAADDNYFPLAGGWEWIYDFETTSPQGDTAKGVFHRKTGEQVEHEGKAYYRSHSWPEDGRPFALDYTKLVRRDAAGFYSIDERDPKRVEKQRGQLPLAVGKKWQSKVESGVLETTVLAKEDVTFGGKHYDNCFRIRIASPDGECIEEFVKAPGVGSLKSEIKRPEGRWTMTLRELKKTVDK